DHPLLMFLQYEAAFLAELIRHEGRGSYTSGLCSGCWTQPGWIRCFDCCDVGILCKDCMISRHLAMPFHHIKKWDGQFFTRYSLKQLGLRIQLGHATGERCLNPETAFGDDFVVLDVDAIHEVHLDYCACETAAPRHTQLLRMRLFPATVANPKTAATFRLLEHFDLVNLEGKTTAFGFYQALSRRTDNTGLYTPKDRYPALRRILREWSHLKTLKRAGRGHDPAGVAATKDGECAVLCPACPQPGKNLPVGWEDAPPDLRWLYTLYLGIDANFRVVRKTVSNHISDPSLSRGTQYIVERGKYEELLRTYKDQPPEVSPNTCVDHDAVKSANGHDARGLASTGLGNVICTRHDVNRPNALGALQKGERYVNMDYCVLSTLQNHGLRRIVLSYDIACQWSRNLRARMRDFPSYMQLADNNSLELVFLVPAFHLPAHKVECHSDYSHNLTKGIGHTEGEAPEREWDDLDKIASSVKEMGPGSFDDKVNHHVGYHNWKKVTSIGPSLLRKMKESVPERGDHVWAFTQLSANMPPDAVKTWTEMVEAWEADNTRQNPFKSTVKTPTQADVRRELAVAEADDIARGDTELLHDTVSPTILITTGFDIEEQQRRLRFDCTKGTGLNPTSAQLAKFQMRSNALRRRINAWRDIQALYIPAAAQLLKRSAQTAGNATEEAYNMRLFLPSEIGCQAAFDPIYAEYEWQLRVGQAHETLSDLRRHLRSQSHMWAVKNRFVRGQRANTRTRVLLARIDNQVQASAGAYRIARKALVVLGSLLGKETSWMTTHLELQPEDVRGLSQEGVHGNGPSSSRHNLSWIWLVQGAMGEEVEDVSLSDALRIEWCNARARAMRWSEDVILLEEEMRRVKAYFSWEAEQWDERAKGWDTCENIWWNSDQYLRAMTADYAEGLRAYALRQADLRRALRTRCEDNWRCVPQFLALAELDESEDPLSQFIPEYEQEDT
ncbi:hypothetical protein PLICRDRAFT_112660, partial [Plicaturopsis crispa FD-325 SS-3]